MPSVMPSPSISGLDDVGSRELDTTSSLMMEISSLGSNLVTPVRVAFELFCSGDSETVSATTTWLVPYECLKS